MLKTCSDVLIFSWFNVLLFKGHLLTCLNVHCLKIYLLTFQLLQCSVVWRFNCQNVELFEWLVVERFTCRHIALFKDSDADFFSWSPNLRQTQMRSVTLKTFSCHLFTLQRTQKQQSRTRCQYLLTAQARPYQRPNIASHSKSVQRSPSSPAWNKGCQISRSKVKGQQQPHATF